MERAGRRIWIFPGGFDDFLEYTINVDQQADSRSFDDRIGKSGCWYSAARNPVFADGCKGRAEGSLTNQVSVVTFTFPHSRS